MTPDDDYQRLMGPVADRMMQTVWRIVGDPDDAEDALQNALTTIWRNFKRVRRHPNPQALLLRICANSAYDALRRRGRRRDRWPLPVNPEDPSGSVEDGLMGREERAQILEAVGRLPRKQAVAVMMRDMQDLPYQDIAQALGCRESTARKHVSRARGRLRRLLSHLLTRSPKEENRHEPRGKS